MTLSLPGTNEMREAAPLSPADVARTAWGTCQIRLVADRVAGLRAGSTHKVYRGWRFAVAMDQGYPTPVLPCSRSRSIRHSWRRVGPGMPWCSWQTRVTSSLANPRPSPGPPHRSGRRIPSPWGWTRRVSIWMLTAGRRPHGPGVLRKTRSDAVRGRPAAWMGNGRRHVRVSATATAPPGRVMRLDLEAPTLIRPLFRKGGSNVHSTDYGDHCRFALPAFFDTYGVHVMVPVRFDIHFPLLRAPPASRFDRVNTALRAEALRRLHWQQREWECRLATHPPGAPCLAPSAHRAELDDCLDLLREAGEYIPPWLHQHESIVRTTKGAGGITGTVRLANLMAGISRVLAWFDPEPSPWARWSRQGDQGGGSVNWKPTDEGHEAAAGEWTAGDRVKARANTIKVRTGSPGTVTGFSTVGGHPLVDFAGSGLVLIRAEHLERDDDAPPEARSPNRPRSSGTTRLSNTPRAPAVAAAHYRHRRTGLTGHRSCRYRTERYPRQNNGTRTSRRDPRRHRLGESLIDSCPRHPLAGLRERGGWETSSSDSSVPPVKTKRKRSGEGSRRSSWLPH